MPPSFHERLGPDQQIVEKAHHVAKDLNERPLIGIQELREAQAWMRNRPAYAAEFLQDVEYFQAHERCVGPRLAESVVLGVGGAPGFLEFSIPGRFGNETLGRLPYSTFQQGYFAEHQHPRPLGLPGAIAQPGMIPPPGYQGYQPYPPAYPAPPPGSYHRHPRGANVIIAVPGAAVDVRIP